MSNLKILQLFLKYCFFLSTLVLAVQVLCQETDIITFNSSIKDPESIVSHGNVFKLGFFTPENTTNRYLSIYYVVSENTIVWVANRNKPLTDSSGTVTISRDGNLVLLNGQNEIMWSTNATTSPLNTTAQILDTGNLVLRDVSSGNIIWESFMHPTNVNLPTMKGMNDSGTSKKFVLTSWKNNLDPAEGNFTHGVEFLDIIQTFTWNNNGRPYWRSGPWNGRTNLGILTDLTSTFPSAFRVENDSSSTLYTIVLPEKFLTKVSLDPFGIMNTTYWDDGSKTWISAGYFPKHECDIYGRCGPFGSCNRQLSPICSCLKGFGPRDLKEWNNENFTGGCVRRKLLQYHGQCNNTESTVGGESDGFLKLRFMKPPDFPERYSSEEEDECAKRCLRNCSCIAHAYDSNIGCMFWSDILIDIQQFPGVGLDLHIRLAGSELEHKKVLKMMIIIPVVMALILISICILVSFWWMRKQIGERRISDRDMFHGEQIDTTIIDEFNKLTTVQGRLQIFSLEMLANATNRFHDDNLLGKGGFGTVYKGILVNGKEIAVKKLSAASNQGTEEFMKEAVVISKLQHKNLVRLIGYCVQKGNKMLVYEYMPNKSLDACLFDLNQSQETIVLDWKKRFSIIEGVGRGLLYLHRDSRLKIIHRDLKPSNVLLDEDLSPKISDFGMARIFDRNEDHHNTTRVAGTYGYMAPEYAMEGRYSEKSDVYSFGVLMLEIISGKRNTNYYNHELCLSFIGSAWKLWSEKNCLAFLDHILKTNSDFWDEIVRCMHIALLCVQEFAKDRPDIRTVLSMLSWEIVDLAIPERPVFAEKWNRYHVQSMKKLDYPSTSSGVLDGW